MTTNTQADQAKSYTTRTAILEVLTRARNPLSAGQIADRVLERELVPQLKGMTPRATITAQVYLAAKNPESPVMAVDGGFKMSRRQKVAHGGRRG